MVDETVSHVREVADTSSPDKKTNCTDTDKNHSPEVRAFETSGPCEHTFRVDEPLLLNLGTIRWLAWLLLCTIFLRRGIGGSSHQVLPSLGWRCTVVGRYLS